jgi:Response regulators consisting of a CheY-like receiver domain and a winged-helix DNA-binding domain
MFLKKLREQNFVVSNIIIDDHKNVCNCVKMLDMGADDYIGKPFELEELGARIRSL